MAQLKLAYAAAERTGGFSVFLSFDMASESAWTVKAVSDLINAYKPSSAQYRVKGQPMVSTFEGPRWAGNWASVRKSTGGIFLVPDWSSLGPAGVQNQLSVIDGACERPLLLPLPQHSSRVLVMHLGCLSWLCVLVARLGCSSWLCAIVVCLGCASKLCVLAMHSSRGC